MFSSRRQLFQDVLTTSSLFVGSTETPFVTRARERVERTNSIAASRDTNISPLEAYQTLLERVPHATSNEQIALDVGAGAGLSTSLLYKELGYQRIEAIDWSDQAWKDHVESTPPTVRFAAVDDDTYLTSLLASKNPLLFDVIVYNFAINPQKALAVSRRFLKDTGILLAPVNVSNDYWYQQVYWVVNAKGERIWTSERFVDAWTVQFQPDVTAENCTGPWCGSLNGFRQKR